MRSDVAKKSELPLKKINKVFTLKHDSPNAEPTRALGNCKNFLRQLIRNLIRIPNQRLSKMFYALTLNLQNYFPIQQEIIWL